MYCYPYTAIQSLTHHRLFIHSTWTDTLETVEESKCLGVTISNNLTWTRHTENVTGKGNRTLGFLHRSYKDCTTQVKTATYTTMTRPTIEYTITVWDPYLRKTPKPLEQVQRRAAQCVLNDYSTRTLGCVKRGQQTPVGKPCVSKKKRMTHYVVYCRQLPTTD